MPPSSPNQRDIARALGVNQATVSPALRGDRSISEAMKRCVRETAAGMVYRPNASVAAPSASAFARRG